MTEGYIFNRMALKLVIARCQIVQKNGIKFGDHERLKYLKECY
jgi:hypothetical protein